MATTAKYPSAALTDFGADMAGFPELTLSGAHDASTTTFTFTSAVPAYWPTVGWFTVDTEIVSYTGKAGSTVTGCGRGAQSTISGSVAATHASGAKAGPYLTPQTMNQIIAEVIAHQSAIQAVSPNIVLNSDFSRRTVFGLAMPEVFADTSAWTSTSALGVAANVLTITTASRWAKWSGPNTMWRDGRWSGTFKAISTTGIYRVAKYVDDADNDASGSGVWAQMNNGNLQITKVIAGTPTTVATVAQAVTLNRWYWLEIEAQGTTYIAKIYDTGGTAPGVTKASSTLLATVSGTASDAQITSGGYATWSDQASSQWGGIATGNGGVYVETWLPESWAFTFAGTLGGQAVGYDEAADSGPIGRQNAFRAYIPATSRNVFWQQDSPDGSVAPSVAYDGSIYVKTSGATANMLQSLIEDRDSALGSAHTIADLRDTSPTSWTRVTATATTASTGRRARIKININGATNGTGTMWVMLPQLEQGSAATAWRGAPSDGSPIVWEKTAPLTAITTTSTSAVSLDDRDLAGNFFLPWDATCVVEFLGAWQNTGLNTNRLQLNVDAGDIGSNNAVVELVAVAAAGQSIFAGVRSQLAAGKHRFKVTWSTSAGTAQMNAAGTAVLFRVTAYMGK